MHDDDNLRHWDSDRVRANHDWTPDDEEREAEIERALGVSIMVMVALGLWKLADLACGSLGALIAFLSWLLTRLV